MKQKKLYYGDNYINYIKQESKSNKKNVSVIFFCGLMSNVNSTKAKFISEICVKYDIEYIRFDYYGHGKSSGSFEFGTISLWLDNCLNIIKSLTDKNLILIGSSMGAWLMLLVSLRLPNRIKYLVGLAPAIDFTTEIIWNHLSTDQKSEMQQKGYIHLASNNCNDNYVISYNLIHDSNKYLLLNKNLDIDLPLILIHGMDDKEVSYMYSIELAKIFKSKQIRIEIIKDAGHNLTRESDLLIIRRNLENIIENI